MNMLGIICYKLLKDYNEYEKFKLFKFNFISFCKYKTIEFRQNITINNKKNYADRLNISHSLSKKLWSLL